MPRYEYRNIQPLLVAEKAFLDWIQKLDEQFANQKTCFEYRCSGCSVTRCMNFYPGRPYADQIPTLRSPSRRWRTALTQNASLEPQYDGDVDAEKYAEWANR